MSIFNIFVSYMLVGLVLCGLVLLIKTMYDDKKFRKEFLEFLYVITLIFIWPLGLIKILSTNWKSK